MRYYVKQDTRTLGACIVCLPEEEGGFSSKYAAWLEYAVKIAGMQGPLGCLGLWLMEQTPEHLEWLPGICLRRF